MTKQDQASPNPNRGQTGAGDSGAEQADLEGKYQVKRRETLAEVPGMRVRVLALLKGQVVPWHFHNYITDTFFCMRGPMQVRTRSPDASHRLNAGDTLAVLPGTPHRVECSDAAECRFMIVQGVGEYDYVPIDD